MGRRVRERGGGPTGLLPPGRDERRGALGLLLARDGGGGRVDAVVLVEGVSDGLAIRALAERRGRDLEAEGVAVVPIGGAQAIGRVLRRYDGLRVAGLCDAGEEEDFRRAFERAGLGGDAFHVCVPDLEGELIRALGADRVLEIVEEHGHLRAFRTLQKQPAWNGRSTEEQLRRFMGSGGRRKIVYAPVLVRALDPGQVPRPLERVLAYVAGGTGRK